jgi:uncharacterized protein
MASHASSPIVVAWQPWSGVAFARARDERKPVLLSISAAWCHSCHEMDRTSYADPEIAAFINDRFVPVRVDADDRPDISERYSLGGWPTTAFLTPGGDILGGGTFVPLERMRGVLARVAEAFRSEPHQTGPRDVPHEPDAIGVRLDEAQLTAQVFGSFDSEYGGFGVEPKFPHTAPLHLALELSMETPDPALQRIVVASLDHMGWSGLHDHVDGGFFRYATTRDWQLPHFEKLLDVNAALTRLFLEAGSKLQQARFTDRASDTLRYIQTWLADPVDGGWYGSQQADDQYYASDSVEGRRTIAAPPVATSLYSDSNAVMVSTALEAAKVFGDDGLREFAIKSLERVLLACYKPGAGVAHYFDGEPRVRGLLADQLAMAAACLDVFDLSGNVVYQMMAEELAHYAVRTMWDEECGGFFDRARDDMEPPIGLMSRSLKPFVTNCEASRTLLRLASASGEEDFARTATAALDAMHPVASAQGPLAAHYLLAVRAARAR